MHVFFLKADTSKSSLQDIKSLAKLNITLHPLNRKESSSKLLSYLSFVVSLGVLVKRIKPSFIFYITLELSFFAGSAKTLNSSSFNSVTLLSIFF